MARLASAIALALLLAVDARAEPTGSALPGLEAYDGLMTTLLRKWDIPGGALAVARRDKLVLARGYGLADKARSTAVEPTSLFRLASLSKTVTAVAVLQLVQDGKLGLDARVLPILGELGPRLDRIADARVHAITVRHLLQHSGGFDRDRSGDPMFMPRAVEAARRQEGPLPPDCPTIMRDVLERRLDFTPGERMAYSNLGYCILGRVIEQIAGTPYEAHVRARVLMPSGATRMRIGRTLAAADGEVTYHDHEARNVKAMPGLGLAQAPRPYGSFAVETSDSYGGWIGAPVDYLRFLLAIDGRRGAALLDAAAIGHMTARSGLAESASDEEARSPSGFYGLGIRVREVRSGLNLWHGGSLPGTSTFAVRTADGFAWVAAFNGRPRDRAGLRAELDRGLWAAKARVGKWPEGDLFPRLP